MKIVENLDLTLYNSYRIKATCRCAYFPENEIDVVNFYKEKKSFILLGSGHNIILSKDYYDEDFLIFHGNYAGIYINDDLVEVEAGAYMWDVSKAALNASLKGAEFFYDIPSSLGGAIVMNAGASGEEIKDILVKVTYFDLEDYNVKEIFKDEMSFEYRNSFFQRNTDKVVLKAQLKLEKANKTDVALKMEAFKASRWNKQPKAFPNGGSVFKRPKGYYVGAIVEELGLKGFSIGGAMISEKHGGFIINYNNATGEDILNIISEVRKRVLDRFNVDLEVEQRVI